MTYVPFRLLDEQDAGFLRRLDEDEHPKNEMMDQTVTFTHDMSVWLSD